MTSSSVRTSVRRQQGFTLVELMIATTVAVFLLAGVFATVQSTRKAYGNQYLMAQLQDNERLAMSIMTNVIESAGYFPDPVNNTATSVLQPIGVLWAASQSITGTANAAAPGDTITVRYGAGLSTAVFPNIPDNALSCIGTTNTNAALGPYDVFYNTFSVDANNNLVCTFSSGSAVAPVAYPLISGGVLNLQIGYGLQKNAAGNGTCTDTYVKSSEMAAPLDWNRICAVRVSITFANPLKRAGVAGPIGQDITITRVVAVMNQAGVT